MKPQLLYLAADDVRRALPMPAAIEAMREAFRELSGAAVALPLRESLEAPEHQGVALVMPCHSAARKLFSVKLVTVFGENPRRGLPLIQSLVTLTDAATGTPLAVLDGASLTAIRTGAASGAATDVLARADSAAAAVFGAGVQARTQLEAVCCVRAICRAAVYDLHSAAAERFAAEMTAKLGLPVERAATPGAALDGADVVCAATTSTTPVFEDIDLGPGVHVNAVGSFRPEVAEVPSETVCRARVVVDHRAAALEEAGDLIGPLRRGLIHEGDLGTELGEVLLDRKPGRRSPEEVTLFKSVGVAIQDLHAGAAALEGARRLGIGVPLS